MHYELENIWPITKREQIISESDDVACEYHMLERLKCVYPLTIAALVTLQKINL